MKNHSLKNYLFITLIGALLYVPFIGSVPLFDWDEINFAESAREMIVTGDYLTVQIDFEPFWEKPPLFIWFQVASMKIFGVNEFSARFPNAVCGIVTLLFLFWMGKRENDSEFGWLLAGVYGGSILPFVYFKSGIIDPWFNLFIFSGIYFAFIYFKSYKKLHLSLAAILIGLAVLTKGPVGFLLFGLTLFVYLAFIKFKITLRWADISLFSLLFILVGGFWFILQIGVGNFSILQDFIVYQIRLFQTKDAGHGGFLLYHWVIVLLGVFPVSFFALGAFRKRMCDTTQNDLLLLMKILLFVVLVLFTIVKTKIVHYSSLAYFPIAFLGAVVIYNWMHQSKKLPQWITYSLLIVGVVISLLVLGLSQIEKYKHLVVEKLIHSDPFAASNLSAEVFWNGWEFAVIIFLLVGIGLFYWFRNREFKRYSVIALFSGSSLFVFSTLGTIVPKIEKYSQHAAIEFFKEKSTCDCYFTTLGYKSYVPYFYGEKKPGLTPESKNVQWLLSGEIDKTTYFVIKNTKAREIFHNHPGLELLYEKNGFVMAVRYPDKPIIGD